MKFNTMYVSKWADGDPNVVRVIETPTYTLHSMVTDVVEEVVLCIP